MTPGLLFSQMEPPAGWEDEFHEWYETDHIPARMKIPGFHSAWRYEAVDGDPRWLACYFLDDLATLEQPAYAELKANPGAPTERMLANVEKFTRYICEQTYDTGEAPDEEIGLLSVVAFEVPEEAEERFDAWYEGEHIPMLMEADGWVRARRFKPIGSFDGPRFTHFALHELRDRSAMDSPERAAARDTEQRRALAAEPWFGGSGRWLYRPIHVAQATQANGG